MSELTPLLMVAYGIIVVSLLFTVFSLLMVLHYSRNVTRILKGSPTKELPFKWLRWVDKKITGLS